METPSGATTGGTREAKTSVQVQLLGQQYTITAEGSRDYILSVAQYVDEQMRVFSKREPTMSPTKAAILTSLRIADELFKERANQQRAGSDLTGRAAELTKRLDDILAEAVQPSP